MAAETTIRNRQTRDEYFMSLAHLVATRSKDPSTKVGAVIVGSFGNIPADDIRSTGYNGLPRGVFDLKSRLDDRLLKYKLTVHAESNAIVNAARCGASIDGCVLYCTMPPCAGCAGLIIQAGIKEVVIPTLETVDRWKDDLECAKLMFREAGVITRTPIVSASNVEKES